MGASPQNPPKWCLPSRRPGVARSRRSKGPPQPQGQGRTIRQGKGSWAPWGGVIARREVDGMAGTTGPRKPNHPPKPWPCPPRDLPLRRGAAGGKPTTTPQPPRHARGAYTKTQLAGAESATRAATCTKPQLAVSERGTREGLGQGCSRRARSSPTTTGSRRMWRSAAAAHSWSASWSRPAAAATLPRPVSARAAS